MVKRYVPKLLDGMAEATTCNFGGEQFVPAPDYDALAADKADDVRRMAHDANTIHTLQSRVQALEAFVSGIAAQRCSHGGNNNAPVWPCVPCAARDALKRLASETDSAQPSRMCPECHAVGGPDGVTNCDTCYNGFWEKK